MSEANSSVIVPGSPTAVVRERWLDLLQLSYATRRVTHSELEPGVHAVVVPPGYRQREKRAALEADVRAAIRCIPELAQGVRLALDKIDQYELTLENDYRQWMGRYGADIASREASVVAFVDLACLEAGLLDCLRSSRVLLDFRVPLSFFRRGAILDYANVLEAVAAMVFEGRSLAAAAARLTEEVLQRLELYAWAFRSLSGLYAQCRWQIEGDSFVMEVPEKGISLTLYYWELRGAPARTIERWRSRIETLLPEAAPFAGSSFPKSYAA